MKKWHIAIKKQNRASAIRSGMGFFRTENALQYMIFSV